MPLLERLIPIGHFAFCIGSHLRQPPDTGGMNATSSPSATAADIFA